MSDPSVGLVAGSGVLWSVRARGIDLLRRLSEGSQTLQQGAEAIDLVFSGRYLARRVTVTVRRRAVEQPLVRSWTGEPAALRWERKGRGESQGAVVPRSKIRLEPGDLSLRGGPGGAAARVSDVAGG
jgi:hypothetical protein